MKKYKRRQSFTFYPLPTPFGVILVSVFVIFMMCLLYQKAQISTKIQFTLFPTISVALEK